MQWYFLFFIISGFCSLVYQVTWSRVAMAAFGVTTPSISIVLSVFMAGLALGSWGGGRLVGRFDPEDNRAFLRLYAAAEALIALSGFVVAPLLRLEHDILTGSGKAIWGSTAYYGVSALLITVALLPFCTCMGGTFPLAMAAVRSTFPHRAESSFSYLYMANVLGAMAGCLVSAFLLIELLGFRDTMITAACLNILVAAGALLLSTGKMQPEKLSAAVTHAVDFPSEAPQSRSQLLLLFITGTTSMAMEIVWTRQFMPYMGPVVYTFATILAIYLGATLFGAWVYRNSFRHHRFFTGGHGWKILAALSGAAALLPLVAADYRLPLPPGLLWGTVRLYFAITPFCVLLGFITPGMLDHISRGEPRRAGFAYALNTLGCITGPLLAGFVLLPLMSERWALLLLALPLLLFCLIPDWRGDEANVFPIKRQMAIAVSLVLFCFIIISVSSDFEGSYPDRQVERDYTATVIAAGSGMEKQLLVNGFGMTFLTPITKYMVHLPLASLERPPRKGLVLCLGMGTSFRSMLSWGIPTTVVELVPSIPRLLPFYQIDGAELLRASNGRIVVDDARRFLERSSEQFDVIVVDPPPPLSAAASSLLYSTEFYAAVAKRLSPGGIFQQWIPPGQEGAADTLIQVAMVKSLLKSFHHVRTFASIGNFGLHILTSDTPIPLRSARQMLSLLPERAAADFVEWGPFATTVEQFGQILRQEVPVAKIISLAPTAPLLTDDRPVNEYYLLRRL